VAAAVDMTRILSHLKNDIMMGFNGWVMTDK
jgi:hypothetical protein